MANGFTADENGRLIELPQFWVMVVFLLDAPEGDGSTRKVKAQSPLALARGSPTFRRMLSEPWVSGYERDNGSLLVPIRAVDWRCFENVIRFLETNHVEIGSTPTALGTLSLSLHYLVYPLAARCVEYLINVNLNPNEVLHVLDVIALPNHLYAPSAPPADREDALLPATSSAGGGEIPSEVDGAGVEHSWDKRFQSALNRLAKHCLDLISRDSERVLKNDALEELGPDALKRILSLDALSVKGESDVFDAVVRWGTFRCRNRSTDLDPNPENLRKCIGDDVLFSVRFLTMSPDDFLRASLLVRFEDDERAFFLAPVSRARAPPHLAPHLDSMSRPRRFLATAAGGPNGNDDNTNNRRSSWRRCFRARSDRRTRSNAGAGEDDHSCLLMGFVSCIACIFE